MAVSAMHILVILDAPFTIFTSQILRDPPKLEVNWDISTRGGWQLALNLMDLQPGMETQEAVALAERSCALSAQWLTALWLWEEVRKKRLEMDAIMLTSAISGAWQHAMSLLKESMETRLVDEILFAAAIGACASSHQWQRAAGLLEEMQQWQWELALRMQEIPQDSSLTVPSLKDIPYLYIDPKLTHRNVPDDFDVPLPLDVLDWGTVHANVTRVQRTELSAQGFFIVETKSGWQGALDLLLQARERGIQVAVHQTVENLAEEARRGAEALRPFWDVAPSRRSLLSRWSHALDLFFQEMQLGQPQSLEDYRAAIKACPRFYWKLSLHLLERMSYEALGPDRLCYREAMRTCNRGLYSYEAAVSLFQDMSAQRLEPGVEEFNDLMLALITGNRWQEAFDIFLDMRSAASRSPKPNLQSFCMVLYACADTNEANAWASAIGYWSDMRKDKITPDFDAYDMLLLVAERSERWDWSRQLLDTLFKLNAPSTVTMFNAALNAARRGKRWELAQSLLREMSEELLLPTIVSYSFAVESCEQADRFDVATQLLQLVDELDLK
eukprot:s3428_g7.t2